MLPPERSGEVPGALGRERRVYRVSELTRGLRVFLEDRYRDVWIEGEVSNFKPHVSGHWYFTLKDDDAQLRAVMFRRENARLRLEIEDGMQALCRGRLTVYEKRGEYQLIVEDIEPRGSGALLVAFERLKARLEREGLFAPQRKRPLPLLPRRVGLVTSPTGAALRDLLEVMRRRDPKMPVLLCPVRVQGDGASTEIAAAIRRLGRSGRVDVIIAGRGGGSIEDLWAFNEEVLARAIAECPVPVVTAIGHEVDFTIADFVADLRAPTPSAAAEQVVPVRADLGARLEALRGRAARALQRRLAAERHALASRRSALTDPRRLLAERRLRLDDAVHRGGHVLRRSCARARRRLAELTAALRQRHPKSRIGRARARLAELAARMESLERARLERVRRAFEVLCGRLHALSPLAILGRGYAIARHPDGRVVAAAAEVERGERLEILLGAGRLEVAVQDVHPPLAPTPAGE